MVLSALVMDNEIDCGMSGMTEDFGHWIYN